jgi:hypothetical protein
MPDVVTVRPWSEADGATMIRIVAIAMEDLAALTALDMIHHDKERAGARFVETGGRVRFKDGEPVVRVDDQWWYLNPDAIG